MPNFDENKKEPTKPGFTKILSLGDFKSSGSKASSKKVNSESGSVTVEIKRKRTISGSSSVSLGQSNTTGLSQEDLKAKMNLIARAEELNKAAAIKEEAEATKKEEPAAALATQPAQQLQQQTQIQPKAPSRPSNFQTSKEKEPQEVEEDDEAKEKFKESLRSKYGSRGRRDSKRIIIHKIDLDEDEIRRRSIASLKRNREKAKLQKDRSTGPKDKLLRDILIPEHITVAELASRMAEKSADVIRKLMDMGMTATINQVIDADTAELVATEFRHKVKVVKGADVESILLDNAFEEEAPKVKRPPIVTVMGHIDHGKTSLLDALRSTNVIAGEAGGITQHIGAYQVQLKNNEKITFIDTPGHEIFTSMRLRGAKVTDVVVLVVAADDGVKEQTVESISHAKAAKVPMIIAINKMDKVGANPQKVLSELLNYECVTESMGGDIMTVEISALKKENLDKLEDAILLQADLLDLTARTLGRAKGAVIESKVDKHKGVLATVLVQEGTLRVGDIIIAGTTTGYVRTMRDDKNQPVKEAGPSMPVEITGLEATPQAGDTFAVLDEEKEARDITEYRIRLIKKQKEIEESSSKLSITDLFAQQGPLLELPVIIKGDTQGSVEAIAASLAKLSTEKVKANFIHKAVGGINESDVTLAKTSKAVVFGFNVGTDSKAKMLAQSTNVEIKNYSIIYNLIEDVRLLMEGKLNPVKREQYLGRAEIRQVFSVSKFGKIAGAFVTDGLIRRNATVKLMRNNIVVHQGLLKTLKRFKDDAKEVAAGYECGFTLDKYDDIKEGDIVEAYEIIEEKDKL